MKQYHDLLSFIMETGEDRQDRTGTGTRSIFGYQMRFDLMEGYPLITTKRIHFKSVACELLWFLSGSTNVRDLHKNCVKIWDEWADESGDLGPIYGKQWREWQSGRMAAIDQISRLIEGLKKDPFSRRHVVSSWNVSDLDKMRLSPCHCLFQFYVSSDRKLSCHLYQRSADAFLGLPFNIASYALLTHMVAHVCSMTPHLLVHSLGDVHIYNNHKVQVLKQLDREERHLPTLSIDPRLDNIFDIMYEDISLDGYDPHPHIKGEVSV